MDKVSLSGNHSGHVVHTCQPLSPEGIICYLRRRSVTDW